MRERTINEAIIEVLKLKGHSMPAKDIYSKIIELDLYQFNSANPYHIVLTQLRRHCVGLNFPTAHKEKHYRILPDGTYDLANAQNSSDNIEAIDKSELDVQALKEKHSSYLKEFKIDLLSKLKNIKSTEFEIFGKKLLEVYGFTDVTVTKMSRDGGIDGFGKLKVGITHLNVAFQCKRWKSNKVSRIEVDKFRGASQGDYEQSILFTTSEFSKEALNATTKKGAIPVILVDGNSIVELMIEKRFGIEVETLPIYLSALDDILF